MCFLTSALLVVNVLEGVDVHRILCKQLIRDDFEEEKGYEANVTCIAAT